MSVENVIVIAETAASPVLVDLVLQSLDAEDSAPPLVLAEALQAPLQVLDDRPLVLNQPAAQPILAPVQERPLVIVGGAQGPRGRDGIDGAIAFVTDNFVLTPTDIAAKQVELTAEPADPLKVELAPYGGVEQRPGVDFTVSGRVLSWASLALELLLDAGSAFSVRYVPSRI